MKRTTLIALTGLLALICSAHAASFDCAKAQTRVEKLICENNELSKLDEDLASTYAAALKMESKGSTVRQAQKEWLKERNGCTSADCLKSAYGTRIASLPNAANVTAVAAAKERRQEGTIKGKFISTYVDSTVCQPFTRNLNEFRHLEFNSCNPRLSPKFPEFSRPVWEEIPFDLELAKKVIEGKYGNLIHSAAYGEQAIYAERVRLQWESWRDRTEALRLAGRAHMWRTRIDFDGDGKEETIIRMVPAADVVDYRTPDKPLNPGEESAPWNCDYNCGTLHMADDARPDVAHMFNTQEEGRDIIYFAGDGRYYRTEWIPSRYISGYPKIVRDVGGTAAVMLSILGRNIGAAMCRIDWVPIKKR